MSNHVAINSQDHKTLRISEERSEAMGDGLMACITFPQEFRSLQNEYPVLFQFNEERDEIRCLVLMGFENGENLYLRDGNWDAKYIPLAMDVQPFMIGLPPEEGADRKVVMDMESPRVSEGEGQRVFDDSGVATAYLETISKKLAYLDEGFKKSGAYIECLKKHDLLEPLTIDVTLKDGSKNRLVGFHTIHQEKLNGLDGDALFELQENGYLLPTYMMLASLSNLSPLIDRKDNNTVNV